MGLGAVLDDRGCDVREPERIQRARCAGAVHLFREHDLFHDAGAAPTPLLGPGDRRVPRVGERAIPRAQAFEMIVVELERTTEAIAAEILREVGVEPVPELVAKRFCFGRIPKVHICASLTAPTVW